VGALGSNEAQISTSVHVRREDQIVRLIFRTKFLKHGETVTTGKIHLNHNTVNFANANLIVLEIIKRVELQSSPDSLATFICTCDA
jgi:hypothetical protein